MAHDTLKSLRIRINTQARILNTLVKSLRARIATQARIIKTLKRELASKAPRLTAEIRDEIAQPFRTAIATLDAQIATLTAQRTAQSHAGDTHTADMVKGARNILRRMRLETMDTQIDAAIVQIWTGDLAAVIGETFAEKRADYGRLVEVDELKEITPPMGSIRTELLTLRKRVAKLEIEMCIVADDDKV